jgi:hypothetical protein
MSADTKKKSGGTGLLIVGILLATAFWVFVIYSDATVVSGRTTIPIADHTGITEVQLNLKGGIAGVDVGQLPNNATDFIVVEHEYGALGVKEIRYPAPEVLNNTAGNVLIVNVTMSDTMEEEFYFMNWFDVKVYLNPNYNLSIRIDGTVGSVDLNVSDIYISQTDIKLTTGSIELTAQNTAFSAIQIQTTAGSVKLDIQESTITGGIDVTSNTGTLDVKLDTTNVTGDIRLVGNTGTLKFVASEIIFDSANMELSTNTGSLNLNWEKLQFLQPIAISGATDTGSLRLRWVQDDGFVSNATVTLETDLGSADIKIEIPQTQIRYGVHAVTDKGSISVDATQQLTHLGSGNYQSSNFATIALPLLDLGVTTNMGSIDIELVN